MDVVLGVGEVDVVVVLDGGIMWYVVVVIGIVVGGFEVDVCFSME